MTSWERGAMAVIGVAMAFVFISKDDGPEITNL